MEALAVEVREIKASVSAALRDYEALRRGEFLSHSSNPWHY